MPRNDLDKAAVLADDCPGKRLGRPNVIGVLTWHRLDASRPLDMLESAALTIAQPPEVKAPG